MKSNMSLMLFSVYFSGLIISLNAPNPDEALHQSLFSMNAPDSDEPLHPSLANFIENFATCGFLNFLTHEQLKDTNFLNTYYNELIKDAGKARQLFSESKIQDGTEFLIAAIRAKTIDNENMNVTQAITEAFQNDWRNVIIKIEDVVRKLRDNVFNER